MNDMPFALGFFVSGGGRMQAHRNLKLSTAPAFHKGVCAVPRP